MASRWGRIYEMGILPSGTVIGAFHALKEVLKGDRSGDPVSDILWTSVSSTIVGVASGFCWPVILPVFMTYLVDWARKSG
jgi:hypothetical protein